jgi:hypothetical protein
MSFDPRFKGSNPAEGDGLLRAIKVSSKSIFGRKVKTVSRFYGILKSSAEYAIDISSAKLTAISCQVSPDWLQGVSVGVCQRAPVDESGIIKTQIATHNTSENGRSVWGALYDTAP